MVKAPLLGIVFAIGSLSAAQAAPATADEASRIKDLFERYVGPPAIGQPSAVTVAPDGESYRVTLDLKQALRGLEGFGVTTDPNLSTTMLTPLPDGTWKVASTDSPPIVIHFRDESIALKAASTRFDGIYDPRMFAFKTITAQYAGYDYSRSGPSLVQDSHTDQIGFTFAGSPDDGGTVTGTAHETVAGSKVDVLMKPAATPPSSATGAPATAPPAKPTTSISYAVPTAALDIAVQKLETKSLLDIWAFLVAHPNRESLVAAQDDLRAILRTALPFATALKEDGTADALSVTTSLGLFSAKTASGGLDLENLDGTAKAATSFAIGGLKVPADQLPPWMQGLVPTDLSIAFGVDGIHAAEAASEAVNDFDLRSDRPFTPDQSTKIGHLAMPSAATVTISPSRLTSQLLDIRFDGAATVSDVPEGHVTIKATGLDKAIASLQSASTSDPSAGQALGPLVLAKNLAKPEADGSLSWLVELKGGGPVTVNGTPLQ